MIMKPVLKPTPITREIARWDVNNRPRDGAETSERVYAVYAQARRGMCKGRSECRQLYAALSPRLAHMVAHFSVSVEFRRPVKTSAHGVAYPLPTGRAGCAYTRASSCPYCVYPFLGFGRISGGGWPTQALRPLLYLMGEAWFQH